MRKRKILETNIKSEEIINFYLIFLVFLYFYRNFFQKHGNVLFSLILLPEMGLFDWGYECNFWGIPESVRFQTGGILKWKICDRPCRNTF